MKMVYAKVSFEGIHCWPDAPEEVEYLKNPHRHIFNVKVAIEVVHSDREIEFIMLGHRLNEFFKELAMDDPNGVWQMGRTSCEDVAEMTIAYIRSRLELSKRTYIIVQVDEDGENGCLVSNGQYCPRRLD